MPLIRILGLTLLLTLSATMVFAEGGVDNSLYAELLVKHVRAGSVDYAGLKADEAKLDAYLDVLRSTKPETLGRDERFAFWINVYNAFTLKLILTEYPDIESIRDIGGFFSSPWKRKFITIDGREMHLDNVEKDVLIPEFRDPRLHFAINCASKSCPPLISVPYEGESLEVQLQENAVAFINDERFNRLEGNTMWLSSIFKWYDDDFGDDVLAYVARYAKGELQTRLKNPAKGVRVKYLKYDWSLNGK